MLTLAALLFLMTAPPQAGLGVRSTCVACHEEAGGPAAAPISEMENDVHFKHGLTCVSCHGGDPTESDKRRAMDPGKGYVGRPAPARVAAFCGRCHSDPEAMKRFNPSLRVDQEAEYQSSVHGKRIAAGDPKPATCVSCHGAHGITLVKDPLSPVYPTRVAETCGKCHADPDYMKPYDIPMDQVRKYGESVHADALMKQQDLSAPTCNDCHGNHGAAPPGAASVSNICGTCHARQAELLSGSPMSFAQCVSCHSNHDIRHPTDVLVGTVAGAACIECHEKDDAGFQAADAIHQNLSQLSSAISAADDVLDRAARAGMEVSHAKFNLKEAKDNLVDARVLVHSFSVSAVQKATIPGMKTAESARRAGEDALGELLYRRKGLAISLVLIALSIFALYLKIRRIEQGQ
jgi:Cytochrome c3